MNNGDPWLAATIETIDGYRPIIDADVAQLTDDRAFAAASGSDQQRRGDPQASGWQSAEPLD